MTALTDVSDLETRLGKQVGSLAGLDLARAQAALDDASELVRAEGARAWTPDTVPAAVRVVVVQVAMRAFTNPDGTMNESVSGGGASYSVTHNTAALGIYLTDAELRTIKAAARLAAGAAGWAGTGTVLLGWGALPPPTHEKRWEWDGCSTPTP